MDRTLIHEDHYYYFNSWHGGVPKTRRTCVAILRVFRMHLKCSDMSQVMTYTYNGTYIFEMRDSIGTHSLPASGWQRKQAAPLKRRRKASDLEKSSMPNRSTITGCWAETEVPT